MGFLSMFYYLYTRQHPMPSPEVTDDTTVKAKYSVTVPAAIRDQLDIEPGDILRWTLTEAGTLQVEVVSRRYGAFEDLDPVETDAETDAVAETESLADEVE